MRKLAYAIVALIFSQTSYAQWRIGAIGGATFNHLSIDKHYMEDYLYDNRWGGILGVMGQYDFMKTRKWKYGLRAELNLAQKNYRFYRENMPGFQGTVFDYAVTNSYFQIPFMANISYGNSWRGFTNLGAYAGYWTSCKMYGHAIYGQMEGKGLFKSQKSNIEFNDERDSRFELGLVGGVGVEKRVCNKLCAQVELRYFYGSSMVKKSYMKIKDPRYNDTFALLGSLCWTF